MDDRYCDVVTRMPDEAGASTSQSLEADAFVQFSVESLSANRG